MRKVLGITVTAALIAGCGGDDGGDQPADQPAGSFCVTSWNGASPDQRAKASLSHRGDAGEPVIVGRYAGSEFRTTGDTFDASGSPKTDELTVAKGDCVAVDLTSNDTETNWAMVLVGPQAGGAQGWYFLEEKGHPLAKPPPPLEGRVDTTLTGLGEEAKLTPQP